MIIARDRTNNGGEVNCLSWDRAKRRNHDDDELNLSSLGRESDFTEMPLILSDKRVLLLSTIIFIINGTGPSATFSKGTNELSCEPLSLSDGSSDAEATLTCWDDDWRFYQPRRNDHFEWNRTRPVALSSQSSRTVIFLKGGRTRGTTKDGH